MSFLEIQTDFFRPLWIRLLLLLIMFAWSLLEFVTGSPFWGIIFGGLGVYSLWQWFFDNWPVADSNSIEKPGSSSSPGSAEQGSADNE